MNRYQPAAAPHTDMVVCTECSDERVTVTLGVAETDEHDTDFHRSLSERVDDELYSDDAEEALTEYDRFIWSTLDR